MNSATENGVNRRKLFVVTNPIFQRQLIGLTVFIAATSCAIVMIGAWFMVQNINTLATEIGASGNLELESTLKGQTNLVWMLMVAALFADLVIVAAMTLIFSNRISGILLRVTRELVNLAERKPAQTIQPRENDFFPELVTAANRLIETSQNKN